MQHAIHSSNWSARLAAAVLACGVLGSAPPVPAVSVEITDGFVRVEGTPVAPPFYDLLGEDFFHGGGGGDFGNVTPQSVCRPCTPDQIITFSSLLAGSTLAANTTFDGVDYVLSPFDRVGIFQFSTAPVQLPGGDTLDDPIIVTAIFAFTGILFLPDGDGRIELDLTGQGIATLVLRNFDATQTLGRHLYEFTSLQYDFTAAPVPEPGTLLLLGSGLLGLALGRRWRA